MPKSRSLLYAIVMFTGIVQSTGKILENQNGWLKVSNPWRDSELSLGQSICVDGCCLTVVSFLSESVSFQLSPETLKTTVFSDRTPNQIVNLEKSLNLHTLLDGHMVSGHVDSVGRVRSMRQTDTLGSWEFWFDIQPEFQKWIISKGSIAINGVSLTLNSLDSQGFSIMCIPHTFSHTNLSELSEGSLVNLEFDLIAKYISRQFELRSGEI